MKLEIYNSITHGSLQPQNWKLPADYSALSHILDLRPTSLEEIERNLNKVLKGILDLHFKDDNAVNINQFINNPQYTPIIEDFYKPEIKLNLISAQTPIERFYSFIITNEAKRIQLQLLKSVDILKDDICSRQEVKDTLSQLARLARNIVEHTHPSDILELLLSIIIKTYYEITLIFDAIIQRTDYISYSDFCSIKLKRNSDNIFQLAYDKALLLHNSQKAFNNEDDDKSNILLPELFDELIINPKYNVLIEIICSLENQNYLQTIGNEIPGLPDIINRNFVRTKFREIQQQISEDFNLLTNAREVLVQIDNFVEILPDLHVVSPEIELPLSIPRLIHFWLQEQKTLYQKNAAQMFVPTLQNGTKTFKSPKATIQKTSAQQLKNNALKFYSFLSGYDRLNKKIMTDESFIKLSEYINVLIETEAVPAHIVPIPQTSFTNEYLRYTFYLIHKELYTTRPIRIEWLELLHTVFTQFKDVDIETSRKKFSTIPTHFNKDVEDIKNRSKNKLR